MTQTKVMPPRGLVYDSWEVSLHGAHLFTVTYPAWMTESQVRDALIEITNDQNLKLVRKIV